MRRAFLASAVILSLSAIGCISGRSTPPEAPPGAVPPPAPKPDDSKTDKEYSDRFAKALGEVAALDAKDAWTAADCERVAAEFGAIGEARGPRGAEALFNAGIAFERCGRDEDAAKRFSEALTGNPDLHAARVHLTLIRHRRTGGKEIDAVIAELRTTAIVSARYQNVEALVALATLCLERNNDAPDTDGQNDRARAVRYLQSALAVDDSYSPAMNGLALYYLGEARTTAGRKVVKSSTGAPTSTSGGGTQAMELAALVCTQAIRRDPTDAVLFNTLGLIEVELGNLGKAAEAFGKARSLRPGFYEAEMNFAAVNLRFRGFTKAEEAYRSVLSKRADDYDARVGLALALRGQIGPEGTEAFAVEAEKELEKAKKIAPDRPEAYYNEGILYEEYLARTSDPSALRKAQELFREFVKKAGASPEMADAVKRANERIKEIDSIQQFMSAAPKSG